MNWRSLWTGLITEELQLCAQVSGVGLEVEVAGRENGAEAGRVEK